MIDVLLNAAESGAFVLKNFFGQYSSGVLQQINNIPFSLKTDHTNIVTDADIASQHAITQTIIEELQKKNVKKEDVGFIAEEQLYNMEPAHMFVIDPLDGTSNFASGVRDFCIPIAYFYKKQIQSSIVYHPLKGDYYIGEKQNGSYKVASNERIRLQSQAANFKSTLLSAHPDDILKGFGNRTHIILSRINNLFRGTRCLGSAALEMMLQAEGIYGAVILKGCYIWDIAAAQLICEEAGYGVYDWKGKELKLSLEEPETQYEFFTCHPSQKSIIVDLLNNVKSV